MTGRQKVAKGLSRRCLTASEKEEGKMLEGFVEETGDSRRAAPRIAVDACLRI